MIVFTRINGDKVCVDYKEIGHIYPDKSGKFMRVIMSATVTPDSYDDIIKVEVENDDNN
jgi:hypothetical protein